MPTQHHAESVRDGIKHLAELLSRHDHLQRERRRTSRVFDQCFGPKTSWRCVVCGRSMPQVPDMGRAHIIALEEGGTTDVNNLIPLCEGSKRVSPVLAEALDWFSKQSLVKPLSFKDGLTQSSLTNSNDLGCHKLFDAGLISRVTIRQIREDPNNWGCHQDVRDAVFDVPLKDLATEFNSTSARARGVARQEKQTAGCEPGTEKWFQAICKLISTARRLAKPRFLSLAQNRTAELERLRSQESACISKNAWALFYYEKALVLMVQQPEPDLRGAIRALEQSCNLASEAEDNRSFAMSCLAWVQAKTFASSRIAAPDYESLSARQESAYEMLVKVEATPADKQRWTMNYLMHRAQLQIKAQRTTEAKVSLSRARFLRENWTVATGWALFQAVVLNTIEGALCALEADYENALRLLARSLIPMKVARGKRPEGYLDIARCAAWVLEQQGERRDATEIRKLISDMRDGRSGFWPFK